MSEQNDTTPSSSHLADEHPIVLFDGVCNLCNGFVQFVIERDGGAFAFASLQSDVARKLLRTSDVDPSKLDSIVLIDDGVFYEKSDAALRIVSTFGGFYRVLSLLRYVPKRVRDAVYEYVATNRYEWFGQRESCMLPSESTEWRFVDEQDVTTAHADDTVDE